MKSKNGPARSVISPCLLVASVEGELEFLKAVFDAAVVGGAENEERTWQAEAMLGDSTLMIGRALPSDSGRSSTLYVWTDDVDVTYARAMQARATSIGAPADQLWGVREASFRDPQGNTWWIGKRIGRMSNREVEEKLRLQRRARL